MITILVVVVAVVGAGVLWLVRSQHHTNATAHPAHTITGALNGRQSGDFSVVSGITALTVRSADLGDDMYRITTPGDANLAPQAQDNGDHIQLSFVNVQGQPTNSAEVLLNSKVQWQVHLVGGATTATVDLRTAKLAGLDFAAGVTRIELWLPPAKGTLAVRLSGGASEFVIHAAKPAPARVQVANGAGSVVVDGATKSGVAGGTVVASGGWDTATDRYDVNIASGIGSVLLDRY